MNELQRLRDLFEAMLEVPMEEWEDWFDARAVDTATRSELRRLAAADDATCGPLDLSLAEFPARDDAPAADPVGARFGPFRLLRRLGEGGMASVFLAVREGADFEQTVALKLLKRGTLSQIEQGFFRRERQVLARLSHPNIARLIDGGVSADGVPYLAMDYVEGVDIVRWCHERSAGLSQRVQLVVRVARAVAAAHAALVVHRDIKPSNVLVDAEGEPKLLDFGIAKLLQDEGGERTRSGYAPMTPEYAAPEQFEGGPITTATDVYALGVLLYELLTGVRPKRGAARAPSAQLSAMRAQGGVPSTTTRRVRGDLDNVVLMALAEDPARRYAGAAAFADDLERYLANQPVVAHPPSAWYRTRKFVDRHRGGVALTALLVLGILASFALALVQARIARQEAARANAVRDFLVGALRAGQYDRPPEQQATFADLIEAADARVGTDDRLDPATRADVLFALGQFGWSAGEHERARSLYRRALEERDGVAGLDDEIAADMRARIAVDLIWIGETDEARRLMEQVPDARYARRDAAALQLGLARAFTRVASGEPVRAVEDLPRLLALADDVHASAPRERLDAHLNVAALYGHADRYEEVERVLTPALAEWRRLALPEVSAVGGAMMTLALALAERGDPEAAIALGREAVALRRRIHAGPHEELANTISNLATLLSSRGERAEADVLEAEALTMRRTLFGPDNVRLVPSLIGVAESARQAQDLEQSEALLADAMRICRIGQNLRESLCLTALHNLAYVRHQRGAPDEGRSLALESLALRERERGKDDPAVATAWSLLATISNGAREHARALQEVDRALALQQADPQPDAQSVQAARQVRVDALIGLGRHAEAIALVDDVIVQWKKIAASRHPRLIALLASRARAQLGVGEREAARRSAAEAMALVTDPARVKPETLRFLRETAAPAGQRR
jgi:tetratricopeptide (TPR) repeat protein